MENTNLMPNFILFRRKYAARANMVKPREFINRLLAKTLVPSVLHDFSPRPPGKEGTPF